MTYTEIVLAIISLFKNPEFQNWFFWCGLVFILFGGVPMIVLNRKVTNYKCNCGCKHESK